MSLFKFKAEKSSGEIYEGKRSAPDKFTLYQDLKREGDTVLSTEEVREAKGSGTFSLSGLMKHVSLRDRILLARNLGSMLEAGLSLARALSVIERQARSKALRDVIQKVSAKINQGQTLSDSLKEHPAVFSSLFVSMVRAGEESGSLPKALRSISEQMSNTYQLQKKIRGAMIYPIIIMVVIVVITILMLIYVVPTLTAVFSELHVELPWNTRVIIYLSGLLSGHPFFALFVIFLLGASAYFLRPSPTGRRLFDGILLRLPVIKTIVQESNSARVARTLSSLLSSGVEVGQSIEITGDVVQNIYFRRVLDQARERIKKGEPLSVVFTENTKLYPIFVGEMISIGEETGKLGEMLSNVADFYEEEVSQKTKDLSTIVEPVLMVVIGCAVAFFALSMLAPMYSLVDSI